MESNESNRKTKRRKTDSRFHSLPDDLLVEILYKLPLEVVFIFRTISKHWNSLISDPCFAFNYCSRRPPPQLTCIRQTMFVEGSVYHNLDPPSYNILHNIHNFGYFSVLPFPQKLQDRGKKYGGIQYTIIGSSNGLLLCASESAGFRKTLRCDYYICNPIPREWIKLPSPIMGLEYSNAAQVGFTTRLEGFLVVASYKVVILHRIQSDLLKFEVFSSETSTWQAYTMNPPCPLQVVTDGSVRWDERYLYDCVVTTDGLLHWVDNSSYNVLISYNPYSDTNSCRLINLPENRLQGKESERFYKRVDAFNGTLRYLEVFALPGKAGACIDIWTLNDYDAGNWTLDRALTVQDRDRFHFKGSYQILGPYHGSDSIYVWWKHQILHICKKIASSNETMKLRYVGGPCYKREDEDYDYDKDKNKEGDGHRDFIMSLSWADILPLSQPIWPTTVNTSSSTTDGHHACPIQIRFDSRKALKSYEGRRMLGRVLVLRLPPLTDPPLSPPSSMPQPDRCPVKIKITKPTSTI